MTDNDNSSFPSEASDESPEGLSARLIVETAPDAVFAIDAENRILFVNRAAEKLFGYSRADLLGRSLEMLMPGSLVDEEQRLGAAAIELPGRHKSGEEISLELSFGAFTEDGQRFFAGIARDITQRKRLERQRADDAILFEQEHAAREEAEAASHAKDEFLTMISHELRTPLTPIIGWIHMIRTGLVPTGEADHGLEVIEKNSHALKHLINDLLDMSAILSGKMRIEGVPLELETALNEALETVRPLAADNQIDIDVSYRNWPGPVIVNGDRARLVQVFWNLLHNAVKFSAPASRVRVICETNSSEAVVSIEDSGRGIPSAFLPHVFERFRQADGSKTRAFGGLGLGLALVKSFVDAHGGTVAAASAGDGRGSRFTIHLPRQLGQPVMPIPIKESAGAPISPPLHLLVVDDDADTLEMLRAALDARGFCVTSCESASEALALAAKETFDLIISDIGMPRVDGYDLMRQLRVLPGFKTVPAVALSGYASQKDADMAIAAGFNAHVSKPIDPIELTALLDRLIREAPTGDPDAALKS